MERSGHAERALPDFAALQSGLHRRGSLSPRAFVEGCQDVMTAAETTEAVATSSATSVEADLASGAPGRSSPGFRRSPTAISTSATQVHRPQFRHRAGIRAASADCGFGRHPIRPRKSRNSLDAIKGRPSIRLGFDWGRAPLTTRRSYFEQGSTPGREHLIRAGQAYVDDFQGRRSTDHAPQCRAVEHGAEPHTRTWRHRRTL